ncbi:CidA/LrgA family protein [Shewanella khirikhana]|uniref:Antiholin-like protein LrgA n=1 Tax=Shewanella khirikhana TaxID=1965282 RepID=A0ABN5TWP3_9GAMM|nr:CidA/LrgA family protein [Shewanella khirikhana]AZQ11878.1 Antiholin-like protein LrgA [Shewanella khirikhana]
MTLQEGKAKLKRSARQAGLTLAQAAAICLLAWLAHGLVLFFDLPLPGGVVGLGVLLLLLSLKWVPEQSLQAGAAWLLGDLLLFFIPPVISVIQYEAVLEQYGARMLGFLVAGSVTVLLGTAWVVDRAFKFERKMRLARDRRLAHQALAAAQAGALK